MFGIPFDKFIKIQVVINGLVLTTHKEHALKSLRVGSWCSVNSKEGGKNMPSVHFAEVVEIRILKCSDNQSSQF